jgi:catechol 1,2-dioxygenase
MSATGPDYFDEARSAEVVNARMGPDVNPRLKHVMEILVKHLHAAVREIAPSHEEWLNGLDFLTKTGQTCSDWRQEFILLSDVLGVSMLVDALNHPRSGTSTEHTILGPFYIPGAPRYPLGANICLDGKGEPLLARGRVLDVTGTPIAGAQIDAWQTNEEGFYDVQQRGIQPVGNLRGVFTSEADGSYWFRTVKPRFYPIPNDGPVGQLLERLGRHPNRAAHIHFIVTAPGYEPLITHVFAPDCQYLREDTVFGVKRSLIADFRRVDDPERARALAFGSPFWTVDWDFVLAPVGAGGHSKLEDVAQ